MIDITNTLLKLGEGSNINCKITKKYPWDNRKDVLKFTLELIKAEIDEGDVISLNFIVKNIFFNGNRKLGNQFETIFYSWDVQDELRQEIYDKYKLDAVGVEYFDTINFKFV
jgi:hypothetical protein